MKFMLDSNYSYTGKPYWKTPEERQPMFETPERRVKINNENDLKHSVHNFLVSAVKIATGIVLLVTFFAQIGCSVFQNAGDTSKTALSLAVSAAEVYIMYENGEAVNYLGQVELSEEELKRVVGALDGLERSKKTLQTYQENPHILLLNMDTLGVEHANIVRQYLVISNVITYHWAEYTPEAQHTFIVLRDAIMALNREYLSLTDMVEANANIQTSLRVLSTAVKIAALM